MGGARHKKGLLEGDTLCMWVDWKHPHIQRIPFKKIQAITFKKIQSVLFPHIQGIPFNPDSLTLFLVMVTGQRIRKVILHKVVAMSMSSHTFFSCVDWDAKT